MVIQYRIVWIFFKQDVSFFYLLFNLARKLFVSFFKSLMKYDFHKVFRYSLAFSAEEKTGDIFLPSLMSFSTLHKTPSRTRVIVGTAEKDTFLLRVNSLRKAFIMPLKGNPKSLANACAFSFTSFSAFMLIIFFIYPYNIQRYLAVKKINTFLFIF